jgi:hypothetical protein
MSFVRLMANASKEQNTTDIEYKQMCGQKGCRYLTVAQNWRTSRDVIASVALQRLQASSLKNHRHR